MSNNNVLVEQHLQALGPGERAREGFSVINVTSRAPEPFWKQLSPFFLGPVPLYDGLKAKNVENAWQYAKVYRQHMDGDTVTETYWKWAREGWDSSYARRYPMGNGVTPEFLLWDGVRMGYLTAREQVYLPLYAQAVVRTRAFAELESMVARQEPIALWDFDSYDLPTRNRTFIQALHDPSKKFGHGLVLYGLLTGLLDRNGRYQGPPEQEIPKPAGTRRQASIFGNMESEKSEAETFYEYS